MNLPLKPMWQLSSSLKASQLHQIATLIGAPLSGTKPQLITGIYDVLRKADRGARDLTNGLDHESNPASGARQESLRVLSIDMGIRNLAFAFLTAETSTASHGISRPVLHQWKRTALTDVAPRSVSELAVAETDTPTSGLSRAASKAAVAESFEPPVLASHAYEFATYCAALNPTHILIERQRFRSGGQSAVQEWSLRVGMLEAMLYATFHSMKAEKLRGMSGTVIEPILPMRVNKYWFQNDASVAKGKQAKLAKIKKVSEMLEDLGSEKAAFDASNTVKDEIVRTFGSKGKRKTGSARQKAVGVEQSETVLSKFDDMADSLLQGLAWLGWQENRMKLLNGGIEALDVSTGEFRFYGI